MTFRNSAEPNEMKLQKFQRGDVKIFEIFLVSSNSIVYQKNLWQHSFTSLNILGHPIEDS